MQNPLFFILFESSDCRINCEGSTIFPWHCISGNVSSASLSNIFNFRNYSIFDFYSLPVFFCRKEELKEWKVAFQIAKKLFTSFWDMTKEYKDFFEFISIRWRKHIHHIECDWESFIENARCKGFSIFSIFRMVWASKF